MFNTRYIIFFSLLYCTPLISMKKNIHIVDVNDGTQLNTFVKKPEKIGIFGATPNYARYKDFCQTIAKHYAFLFKTKEQKKSVKHLVGKKLNKAFNTLKAVEKNALTSLNTRETDKKMIDVFLNNGIEQKTIQSNVQNLVQTAQEGNTLIHVFLPTYFAKCSGLSNETIVLFLHRAALYYQQMYHKCDLGNLKVLLLIPSIKYFASYTKEKNPQALQTIKTILTEELFSKLPDKSVYGLINQNAQQNQELLTKFKGETYRLGSVPLYTFDRFGKQAHNTFTPYLLKHERTDDIEKEVRSARLITTASHQNIMKVVRDSHGTK